MRCKNCGSENDENLYICQNCGSPLYDEEEIEAENNEATQIFAAQKGEPTPKRKDDFEAQEEKKRKQNMIIIAVLCFVLVAIIAGTVIAIVSAKHKNEADQTSLTQVSTSQTTTKATTREATTESTTESTTEETTTTTTTTTTTQAPKLTVSISTNAGGGGEYEGEGEYDLGDTAVLRATPDDGYEFDGWYVGNKKVSSSKTYKFTVTKDISIKAVFAIINQGADSEIPELGDDED